MTETPRDRYRHPLSDRYVSRAMERVFAPGFRFGTWRRLWLALAETQQELGLDISDEALEQMRRGLDDIDLDAAAEYEKRFRHDVMAHVHLFGDVAPAAKPVLHLGATSAFVGDNTDLIQHREAMTLVRQRLVDCIRALASFAEANKDLATLAYTHFQPAQPTTVGKRATLWIQDLLLDLEEVEHRLATLKLRGVRGTTGTQASFLQLFDGDHDKVDALDAGVCERLGFGATYPVSGQTYSRKVDHHFLSSLAGIAASASKMANDIRLLAHLRELEEPFEEEQIGSSAMPYKRNPMRSERICALARHVIALSQDPAYTAATQWLERSLDDSANKRLSIPDAYMAVDAILMLTENVSEGLRVNRHVVSSNLGVHLPFMAMESVLMDRAAAGGDRQELHEAIRQHALAAARRMNEGVEPDLFGHVAADPVFSVTQEELAGYAQAEHFVGRAPAQVDQFLTTHVAPVLARYPSESSQASLREVRV